MLNDKNWQPWLIIFSLLVLYVTAQSSSQDKEASQTGTTPQDESISNTVAQDALKFFGATVLYTTASLTLLSTRYALLFTYKLLSTVLNPLFWLLHWLWITFIVQPLQLLLHIAHVLYPVAMFCLAAVLCGTIIGGCAGFAAEAISAFTISATWGKPIVTAERPKKKSYYYDAPDNDDDEVQSRRGESIAASESSSVDDSVFFGADATASSSRDAFQNVDSWRKSILSRRSSSSSSSFQQIPARSMHMSTVQDKEDNWNWPEEEEEEEENHDEFPRRRRQRQNQSQQSGGL